MKINVKSHFHSLSTQDFRFGSEGGVGNGSTKEKNI